MTTLAFVVTGTPAPQGSKKGFLHPQTGRVIITDDNPKTLKTWRAQVRTATLAAITHSGAPAGTFPLDGPLRVDAVFYMPRPQYHYRTGRFAHLLRDDAPTWCDKKPDVDKLIRAVLDALTQALIYRDDNQVVGLVVEQRYAATHERPDQQPGVHLGIRPLPQPVRAPEQEVLL